MNSTAPRADVYSRVTNKIIADLERGVRPWLKPWNAEHAAGRITRPLRANGQAYKGINILMLWGDAELKGFACPIWMTFRQAQELGAHVKKGEHGSLVVYADKITRTETDESGEEALREIAFMKRLHGVQLRADRGLAVAFLRDCGATGFRFGADRECREFRRQYRRDRPPWRQPGLLLDHRRLRADAAFRELPRCGKLLRDASA
jgi:hypothetical protein